MMAAFSDVFADVTKQGTKLQTSEYLASGKYPIIDQGQDDIAGYTDREDGLFTDVPAIIFGDHTRIVKYVDMPFFLGADGVKVLKATIPDVDCRYLYYAVSAVKIPNTGYNRHFKWLKEAQIPLPDLPTQRRIAATLDKVSEGIALCRKMLDELDLMVKAKFGEMFGTLPANELGWSTGTIRDCVTEVRYGSSRKAAEGDKGQYPYLRMNNITYDGELDLTDVKSIDVPDDELDKCSVRRGDVLFNRTNSRELVGKTCVYNRDELMVLAGFVVRVRVNERMLPEFLSAFMNSTFTKRLLLSMCKTAIGQANINAQEFQNIEIYIPPITLQREFVDFKEQIDKSKLTIQKILDKMEMEKLALMQGYFG